MSRDWWHLPLAFVGWWTWVAMALMGDWVALTLSLAPLLYVTFSAMSDSSFPGEEWLSKWPGLVISAIPCLIFYAQLLGWL